MYPYYNTYSVFFGSTETDPTVVTLKLSDYSIDPQSVLNALIAIQEKARLESNETWRSEGLKNTSMDSTIEMRKAKLKSIAVTVVDPLDSITQMVAKSSILSEKPLSVVAPLALADFATYADFVANQIMKYEADLTESLKQPENYEALNPTQKAEVDKLQVKLDEAKKQALAEKKKALPWYKTEIPFYIGGGLALLIGGHIFFRGLK
jgi:hypothetical protein